MNDFFTFTPETLTIAQVADYCNVSANVVNSWIDSGVLPVVYFPGTKVGENIKMVHWYDLQMTLQSNNPGKKDKFPLEKIQIAPEYLSIEQIASYYCISQEIVIRLIEDKRITPTYFPNDQTVIRVDAYYLSCSFSKLNFSHDKYPQHDSADVWRGQYYEEYMSKRIDLANECREKSKKVERYSYCPKYLTIAQVAVHYGITAQLVQSWIENALLPVIKMPGLTEGCSTIMMHWSDLQTMLLENHRRACYEASRKTPMSSSESDERDFVNYAIPNEYNPFPLSPIQITPRYLSLEQAAVYCNVSPEVVLGWINNHEMLASCFFGYTGPRIHWSALTQRIAGSDYCPHPLAEIISAGQCKVPECSKEAVRDDDDDIPF